MEIIKKINSKNNNIYENKPVTIVFLGDSVTQGCFECFFENNNIQTVFDYKSAYSTRLKEILNIIYPMAQINIINSGISGDNALNGLNRFDRDVKPFNPDLVVVSYGLNDACQGKDKIDSYLNSLKGIFDKIREINSECIFIFQNMMNTKVSPHLKEEKEIELAERFASIQNEGILDFYHDKAKELSDKENIKFLDIYDYWKKMSSNGVDVTEMLANYYNHPKREFHYFIALKLIEMMFE